MLLFHQTWTSRQVSIKRNARQRRRVSSATTNWIFMADVYMATPAVFKTPIVNVTHSGRRHIAAFLMRGIRERVLCAKLTIRWAKIRGEREIALIVSGSEKENKEETKARIALVVTKQMRVPRWVTVLWRVSRRDPDCKKKKKESVCNSGKFSLLHPYCSERQLARGSPLCQPDNIECNVACDVIIRN